MDSSAPMKRIDKKSYNVLVEEGLSHLELGDVRHNIKQALGQVDGQLVVHFLDASRVSVAPDLIGIVGFADKRIKGISEAPAPNLPVKGIKGAKHG